MKEQSAPRRREATTPVKLVAADVLPNRKNEIQNVIARRAYELFEAMAASMARTSMIGIEAEVESRAYLSARFEGIGRGHRL